MGWKLWIDTGGTFTDCIGHYPNGEAVIFKILSSSALRGKILSRKDTHSVVAEFHWPFENDIFKDYTLRCLESGSTHTIQSIDFKKKLIRFSDIAPQQNCTFFEITAFEEVPVFAARLLTASPLEGTLPPISLKLGSTKGTNALLEKKGAKTALIVTKGFKDLLLIGTQQRPELFSLTLPDRQVIYTSVHEVEARRSIDGTLISRFRESEIEEMVNKLKTEGVESVAVSLLHAYKYPDEEEVLGSELWKKELKNVSLSSHVSPLIKYLDRTETTLVNAYLAPVIEKYVGGIRKKLGQSFHIMTSAGGLADSSAFLPKDSLLSGPAGGVVGAVMTARAAGYEKVITLDMGGTSTDIALYDGNYDYRYVTEIDQIRIQSPCLAIETIAAGGGSIVDFDGMRITVGPHSAGAKPGPACYGDGGPLTLTDINLLAGRIHPDQFSIPLQVSKSENALNSLKEKMGFKGNDKDLIFDILAIADEKMAEAIRKVSLKKGLDPSGFALLAFGGAGGQHATSVATILGISDILVPYRAGVLSAYGIGHSSVEVFKESQVLKPWGDMSADLEKLFLQLEKEALTEVFIRTGNKGAVKNRFIYLRQKGQESTIEIDFSVSDPQSAFLDSFERIYGYRPVALNIEIESIRLIARDIGDVAVSSTEDRESIQSKSLKGIGGPEKQEDLRFSIGKDSSRKYHLWESCVPDEAINGESLVISGNSTVYIPENWNAIVDKDLTLRLHGVGRRTLRNSTNAATEIELFTNRFRSIADEMGAILERSSFSVNIRERLDFSCALLDSNGVLIVNAPHIPVHLGSLGVCVREVKKVLSMEEGDIIITNHPAYGGSHLPDVTLIAPFFFQGQLLGYLVNRAHHAEIGGMSPGSMPANAQNLNEEGVVISPRYLRRKGQFDWEGIEELLSRNEWPSRSVAENLADLQGAVASLQAGMRKWEDLANTFGAQVLCNQMKAILDQAWRYMEIAIDEGIIKPCKAEEQLDDGSLIKVEIKNLGDRWLVDLSGSGNSRPDNLNATPAIVNSVVLYVLRVLINRPIPLNEGLLNKIDINIPEGSLFSPVFPSDPALCPAVVGGNTELSQRLTDTLFKAFEITACSQGTMNNFLFGNDQFGYYETICGGSGAGPGYHGASAVHTHMTNTRITDPEIMEFRYPVRLEYFSLRRGSGGKGKWTGGDGILREIHFLQDCTVTLLAQHRKIAPYGMEGGEDGSCGIQWKTDKNGNITSLPGRFTIKLQQGESIGIGSPGGGGWSKSIE